MPLLVILFKALQAVGLASAKSPDALTNLRQLLKAYVCLVIYKVVQIVYRRRNKHILNTNPQSPQLMQSGFPTLPVPHSKNSYPIILVHGFMGWAPDESHRILGNYWD